MLFDKFCRAAMPIRRREVRRVRERVMILHAARARGVKVLAAERRGGKVCLLPTFTIFFILILSAPFFLFFPAAPLPCFIAFICPYCSCLFCPPDVRFPFFPAPAHYHCLFHIIFSPSRHSSPRFSRPFIARCLSAPVTSFFFFCHPSCCLTLFSSQRCAGRVYSQQPSYSRYDAASLF